jgi:hypothetical protein
MKNHEYYSVAIGNSTTMERKPAPDRTCGHKHRTIEAAEKCMNKLLNWRRDPMGGGRICDATWYNGYILGRNDDEWERIR